MTCIVGLVENDIVYMGGDSAATTSGVVLKMVAQKVFRNKDFLMGFTGVVRGAQLLRYSFTPPDHPDSMDVETYLATLFINTLRTTFRDGGNASKSNEYEYASGAFLIGYRGRLFSIGSDYSFVEAADGYHCIGSGGEVALGAMHATHMMSLKPYKRIELALQAAEAFCDGVQGPFVIDCLGGVQ
jgi:ATP-dependent protease HslVU (ClpYQ) peptidase subunit